MKTRKASALHLKNYEETTGLYLHFPFCRRCCHYCHFTTLKFNPEEVSHYLTLLKEEMGLRSKPGMTLDSLYLGGGSPSLLDSNQLEMLMNSVNGSFHRLPGSETSIEANPEDLSAERILGMIRAGFNRISIGVQSLDEADLNYLGRKHSMKMALEAILAAAKAGFTRINADLIIGLPTQTRQKLQKMLARLFQFPITHLSLYLLEKTPEDTRSREYAGPHIYHGIQRFLEQSGFVQYEISNFSLPGEECQHNLRYWTNRSYMAVGISAAGFLHGVDYRNTPFLTRYRKAITHGKTSSSKRRIPLDLRRLITGLRLIQGVESDAFSGRWEKITPLLDEGVLVRKADHIAVAPDKMLLLNEILARYIL